MNLPLASLYLDGNGGTATFPTCVFFDTKGNQQDTPSGGESLTIAATTTKGSIVDWIALAETMTREAVLQWMSDNQIAGMRSGAITGNPCDVYSGSEQVTTPVFTLAVGQRAYLGTLPTEAYPAAKSAQLDPVIESYVSLAINLGAGANQELVAAPGAGKQIWVYGLVFGVNVAGTVAFEDSDATALTGIMQFGVTGGMTCPPSGNFAMPLWKGVTAKNLRVDVVTAELDGVLTYAIVSV